MSELLAINLAHNISTDQKSVEETRRTDGEIVQRKMDGEALDYTQDFQFELQQVINKVLISEPVETTADSSIASFDYCRELFTLFLQFHGVVGRPMTIH